VQHVVGDDRRPAAVLAFAGGGAGSFEGGLSDVLAFGLRYLGEEPEEQAAGAAGVVHARQGSGEHLQDRAVGGEVVGERGEFGGVAPGRFISYTMKMTRQCGACAFISRAAASAAPD
jgi:hypothetical protein